MRAVAGIPEVGGKRAGGRQRRRVAAGRPHRRDAARHVPRGARLRLRHRPVPRAHLRGEPRGGRPRATDPRPLPADDARRHVVADRLRAHAARRRHDDAGRHGDDHRPAPTADGRARRTAVPHPREPDHGGDGCRHRTAAVHRREDRRLQLRAAETDEDRVGRADRDGEEERAQKIVGRSVLQ